MAVTNERMRAISAAFNSRDVDRIVDCFAEAGVFCLARGPESVGRTLKGKAAIRQALAERFNQIPDMRWENEEYILAGAPGSEDRAVSIWTVRGRGVDGEELNYQGCDIYRFDPDGKIVHKNTFWKIVEHKDRL
jgi:ketosteroid isomerase-like protein